MVNKESWLQSLYLSIIIEKYLRKLHEPWLIGHDRESQVKIVLSNDLSGLLEKKWLIRLILLQPTMDHFPIFNFQSLCFMIFRTLSPVHLSYLYANFLYNWDGYALRPVQTLSQFEKCHYQHRIQIFLFNPFLIIFSSIWLISRSFSSSKVWMEQLRA